LLQIPPLTKAISPQSTHISSYPFSMYIVAIYIQSRQWLGSFYNTTIKQISASLLSNSFFPFQVAAFCSSLKGPDTQQSRRTINIRHKSENSKPKSSSLLSPLCTDKTTDSFRVDGVPFENVYLYYAVIKMTELFSF
jgi:hypothetical protein